MKKYLFIALLLMISALIISCAGEDEPEKDTTPPFPPTMIPHLGDTGDPQTNYYGRPEDITDDNNGIDAVPEDDWIQISWMPFIDDDINTVSIWRFDEIEPEPILLHVINNPTDRIYVDRSNDLHERNWYSYYIDVADIAGNISVSDTVSYALLQKPVLLEPLNNATVPRVGTEPKWMDNAFASSYRFLLFDSMHNYLWHHDIHIAMEDEFKVLIPVTFLHSGQSYYWRVDSFEWDEDRQAYMGAESQERTFHVQ